MGWCATSQVLRFCRFAGLVAAAVALVALVAACGGGSEDGSGGDGGGSSDGGTIRTGVIAPFTGAYAAYGEPEKASVEAAVDAINSSGGIKVGDQSHQLEAIYYDGGVDPTKAVTATRKAISQDDVSFLTVLVGDLIPPVQPVVGENALIFAVANGNEFLGPDQKTTFRAFYDMPQSVAASLRYLKGKLGPNPKVAMVYQNNEESKELASISTELAEDLGYEASATYFEPEATDFAPTLTNVLAGNPEVIDFGNDSPSQYSTMVKQARQLGYKGTFVFPDTIVQSLIEETAGPGAAAGSVTSPTFTNFSTPEGKKWAKHMEAKSGPLQGWAASSYDALFLLKAAIEKSESTDVGEVAEALSEVSLENGLLGKDIRFEREASSNDGYTMVGMEYPVAELTAKGDLKIVADYTK